MCVCFLHLQGTTMFALMVRVLAPITEIVNVHTYTYVALGEVAWGLRSRPVQHKVLTQSNKKQVLRFCRFKHVRYGSQKNATRS